MSLMSLTVEDLDAWYAQVKASGLFDLYETAQINAPQNFPWGVREVHFTDPAGVCWHVAGT